MNTTNKSYSFQEYYSTYLYKALLCVVESMVKVEFELNFPFLSKLESNLNTQRFSTSYGHVASYILSLICLMLCKIFNEFFSSTGSSKGLN